MSLSEIPDTELLRRAVQECRAPHARKGELRPRWTAVMATFMLGSNYSRELCQRFGFDPDEMVKR